MIDLRCAVVTEWWYLLAPLRKRATEPVCSIFRSPVWLLGWVSLATDAATEAIYPLLPFFLTRVLGAGAVSLGIIEGAAEAVNSVLKIVLGRAGRSVAARSGRSCCSATACRRSRGRSSRSRRRGLQVFTVRVLDRVGKGVRGAPRDAMLAGMGDADDARQGVRLPSRRWITSAPSSVRRSRRCFCFSIPDRYRTLFALTIIPGAIAVALIFLVPEEDDRRRGVSRQLPADRAVPALRRRTSSTATPASARVHRVHARPHALHARQLHRRVPAAEATDVAGTARVRPADVGGAARREGGGVDRRRQLVGSHRPARGDRDRLAGVRGRLRGFAVSASRCRRCSRGSCCTASTSASPKARRRRWSPTSRRRRGAASRSASTTPCRASARSPRAWSSALIWNAFGAAGARSASARALALVGDARCCSRRRSVRADRHPIIADAMPRFWSPTTMAIDRKGIHALADALRAARRGDDRRADDRKRARSATR